MKKEQKTIDAKQQECDDYNEKISELDQQKNKKEFEVLNEMLQRAEDYKKILEKEYKDCKKQLRNQIITSLNSLYEIAPYEG
ncbi:MAG: hypothetical protein U9532_00310 ['Conium maculatum' witches'-broom phytoplasma]|nr:hypothetical protein ['Conium maculatum' witches'-broom phytoplasma]